jgi:hypothetical protein
MQFTLDKPACFKEHLRNIKYNRLELSSVANHVLEHVNEPNSNHTINLENFSLLKEIRKPSQLDAYESFFIRKLRKQNHELMNGDDGNIKSRLFDLLLQKTIIFIFCQHAMEKEH